MKPLLLLSMIFLSASSLKAEGSEPVAPLLPDNSMIQTLTMLAIGAVFFYFILYRPEQQKRKALDDAKSSLKKGDKVVALGIIGTVFKIESETVILKMYDDSKIEVLKGAISDIQSPS
jgi:preprotein translocase subunit YajC